MPSTIAITRASSRVLQSVALFALLFLSPSAWAQLQFPQLSAVGRTSPATLGRGDPVTIRFTPVFGTAPTQAVTFIFQSNGGRAFRVLRATDASAGVASATVDTSWSDDTYQLVQIAITDVWARSVFYTPDGAITTSTAGNRTTDYYVGPSTHRFDLAQLGFTVRGASNADPLPALNSITALTSDTLSPGQTARFRFDGAINNFALAGAVFTFRNGTSTCMASIAATTLTGEFTVPIGNTLSNGRYRLSSVLLTDQTGIAVRYSVPNVTQSILVSVGGYSFTVEDIGFLLPPEFSVSGAGAPLVAPRLADWRRDTDTAVGTGTTARFTYTTAPTTFPVKSVEIRLTGPFGAARNYTVESASGTFNLPVAADWMPGLYTVAQVTVTDTAGNVVSYLPRGGTASGPVAIIPVESELFQFSVTGTTLPPYFTIQPAAEVGVKAGNEATLFARAVGARDVTYQWYRGEPGDTSVPLSNNVTTFINATGEQLVVRGVTGPATYWVLATSGGVSTASTAAHVFVALPPTIATQPVSQVITPGGNATFSVIATGTGPFTYSWRTPAPTNSPTTTQPVLELRDLSAREGGIVYCEVTGPGGITVSQVALLTVLDYSATLRITNDPGTGPFPIDPRLLILRAEFSGNPPFLYRWEKDGVDLPQFGGSTTASSYQASLVINRPTEKDEGVYRFVVTNGFETAYSSQMRLSLTVAPYITSQPRAQVATQVQGFFGMSVSAAGSGLLTYQWRRNGVAVAGATSADYNRFVPDPSVAGTFDVVVTNTAGSVTSTPTVVTVDPKPFVFPTIFQAPASRTARPGETVTFSVGLSSTDQVIYRWAQGSRDFPGGTDATFTLRNVGSSDSGAYQVYVSGPSGSGEVRSFTLTVAPGQDAPVITRQPALTVVQRGSVALLEVGADGRGPLRYQWRYRGVPLPLSVDSATQPALRIVKVDGTKTGAYDVVVTNDFGSVTSAAALLSLPPPSTTGRLMNLSVRASAGGSAGPLVVGFVLGGGTPESVPLLVRGAGNALAAFGVADVLANPTATLYSGGAPRFINDDWFNYAPVAAVAAQVGAFPFPASASRDAAFAPVLAPGAYTLHLNGHDAVGGVALAEIYDATPAAEITDQRPRLLNLSVQTKAAAGNPVIVGFALGGTQPKRVLIRGVGPSLAAFGVAGILSDPQLTLQQGSAIVATNNDWAGTAALREAFGQVGAFQLAGNDSKDAALIATLTPGPYTVQASGVGDTAGAVLVEVYELP